MTQAIARNVQEGHLLEGHIISMRILVYAFTCLSLMMVSRVVGAEIIPQDRRIAWAPGVPGGIPYYQTFANVRAAPYNAVGDGVADDTAAIQSAVNGCPEGRAVLIPQGTYRITNTISIRSRIVLRGEGPGKTRIIQDNPSGSDVIWMGRWTGLGSQINLQADAPKGTTQLSLASTAGLASGDYLVLSQLNKPGLVTDTGYRGVCTWCGNDVSSRSMTQIVPISSVVGNTVTLARPVYLGFSTGLIAQVQSIALLQGAGIEDLYVEQRTPQGGGKNIAMIYLSRSWIKNVESYNAGSAHVQLSLSYGCEIRDSYFHEAHDYSSGKGYGIVLMGWNSDHLIENNIIRKTRHSMIFSGGSGCVYGYNYCIDVYTQPDTNFLSEDANTHGAHPFMNLFEGNVFAKLSFDNTWGSSSHNTVFRNHITAVSPGTVYGIVAVDVEQNNYFENVVGNVLGAIGVNFEPWRLGFSSPGTGSSSDDPNVIATLLRHGNVDNRSSQTQWDPGIQDQNIPDSYYLSERPGFFSGFAWPAIGPDYGARLIPAQARYEGTLVGIPPAPPTRLRIVN